MIVFWRALNRWPQIHRFVHREAMKPCILCRFVWGRLMADERFAQALAQGKRDFDEGRTTRYVVRNGKLVPVDES